MERPPVRFGGVDDEIIFDPPYPAHGTQAEYDAAWADEMYGMDEYRRDMAEAKRPTFTTNVVNGRPQIRWGGEDDALRTAWTPDLTFVEGWPDDEPWLRRLRRRH